MTAGGQRAGADSAGEGGQGWGQRQNHDLSVGGAGLLGPSCCASRSRCQPSLGPLLCLTLASPSRVHITEATLNHLDKAYEVEDGHGQRRDPYLKEMNIRTYLVIDPRVRGLRCSRRVGGWREGLETWSVLPFKAVRRQGRGLPGVGVSSPRLGVSRASVFLSMKWE